MLRSFRDYRKLNFSHVMYAGSMHKRLVRLPVISCVFHNDFRARHIAFHKICRSAYRRGRHLVRRGFISRLGNNSTFQHDIFKLADFQSLVKLKFHIVVVNRRYAVYYGKLAVILCGDCGFKAEYNIICCQGISLCIMDIIVNLHLISLWVGLLPVLCQNAVCYAVFTGNHILIGGK